MSVFSIFNWLLVSYVNMSWFCLFPVHQHSEYFYFAVSCPVRQKFMYEHLILFFLRIYLAVEFLGSSGVTFVRKTHTIFVKWLLRFLFLWETGVSKMLPNLTTTCYFALLFCFLFVLKIVFGLHGSHLVHKNLFLTMVLGIIFLTTNHVQWTSPHANCPFHIFWKNIHSNSLLIFKLTCFSWVVEVMCSPGISQMYGLYMSSDFSFFFLWSWEPCL